METGPWGIPSTSELHNRSNDVSLFSSSLPVLNRDKLKILEHDSGIQSTGKLSKNLEEKAVADDFDLEKIGSMLPDDEEELLAGIMDDFDLSGLPSQVEEMEDYDVFGGMELDFDTSDNLNINMSNSSISDGFLANGIGVQQTAGAIVGEHPFGEHPSRTLFVRNINSNVEDSELRTLFEQYGDIRTLYTACKHRGFVMISYYDIRAARTAMRALQNKPLRRRKLDIHFSIPKDNPSDKDINQGTLVAFNLDPSVSNDDLHKIFGVYGEVKEIRETPHKRHHKFIEFYDVRAAEAALRSLNRSDIAGKRIKLEPSRPGGARRNLMQQLTHEFDQSESKGFRHPAGSPIASSPPGTWLQFSNPTDNGLPQSLSHSPTGLASILPPPPPIGKDHSRLTHPGSTKTPQLGLPLQYPHSFPDQNTGLMPTNSQEIPGRLTQSHILWGSPGGYTSPWSTLPNSQTSVFPYTDRRGPILGGSHHHVGSAPTSFFGFSESPDTAFMNMGLRTATAAGGGGFRMIPPQRLSPVFLGTGSFSSMVPGGGFDALVDRGRARRLDNPASLTDNKRQYHLDLEKIVNGEDTRTTLMIKNIPNKYTSKMLLAAIDENHKGTYDFFYLPIDFKNKCNVGYAFINMVAPTHIPSFYETFNGKKWEKFNSEKVASLAYARIQGKTALVSHFQNSSLMNEDKRCHPILFHSAGPDAGSQEPFPPGNVNAQVEGTSLVNSVDDRGKAVDFNEC